MDSDGSTCGRLLGAGHSEGAIAFVVVASSRSAGSELFGKLWGKHGFTGMVVPCVENFQVVSVNPVNFPRHLAGSSGWSVASKCQP